MSDAPERIWSGVLTDEYRGMVGTKIRVWGNDPRVGTDDPAIEYIRADLVEALEAENQQLRDEITRLTVERDQEREEHTDTLELLDQALARAALRSTEASHD